jgi:L-malate glycosyltransferase
VIRLGAKRGTSTNAQSESYKESYVLALNWPLIGYGGVNEVVLGLAQQIEKLSTYHAVITVTTWDYAEQPREVRGNEVANLRLRDPLGPKGILQLLATLRTLPVDAWRCLRFMRERRVEVWNAHFPGSNVCTPLLLQRMGFFKGKILLSFHGSDFRALDELKGYRRAVWRTVLTQTDAVIACSRDLAESVKRFAPRAKVITIHNGVDLSLFSCERIASRARRSILHVGKFDSNKAQDVLLRAFYLLLKSVPDASLVLVGSNGPSIQQVRDLVADLGLGQRVEILVDVQHELLPRIMDRADLFVLPSRKEALPLVLLEAGAANLPVVASRTGGIPELIEDGVTGVLVSPGDIETLEAAMRDLLLNTERADGLSRAWHEQVVRGWSWQRTATEYLSLLRYPMENQSPKRD